VVWIGHHRGVVKGLGVSGRISANRLVDLLKRNVMALGIRGIAVG